MARVDFYVLPGSGEIARRQFACRLAEKAYRLENRVHIQTADPQATDQLDDLLWTFRDGSFVPHEIVAPAGGSHQAPITLGHEAGPERAAELLINLTNEVPAGHATFPRIAEIVTSDDESRRQSRRRYAQYRDQGHTLETHTL